MFLRLTHPRFWGLDVKMLHYTLGTCILNIKNKLVNHLPQQNKNDQNQVNCWAIHTIYYI